MLKKLLIILIVSLSIIAFSNIAWASVIGTWEITGKVTTTIKGKGIKTTIIKGALDGDSWIFNEDNSFDSDNIGGTWSQVKTKFAVNFNDDEIISLTEEALTEEFGTDITVNAITKKTFTGTENAKKGTIKGSFKIYMTASGYDEDCICERTGKVTVSGSFNGTLSDGGGNNNDNLGHDCDLCTINSDCIAGDFCAEFNDGIRQCVPKNVSFFVCPR
jgi:hypothetical protein